MTSLPQTTITESIGPQSGLKLLSVDRLCVVLLENMDDLQTAVNDLKTLMVARNAQSGSVIIPPTPICSVRDDVRLGYANMGISISHARTPDLDQTGTEILSRFACRETLQKRMTAMSPSP